LLQNQVNPPPKVMNLFMSGPNHNLRQEHWPTSWMGQSFIICPHSLSFQRPNSNVIVQKSPSYTLFLFPKAKTILFHPMNQIDEGKCRKFTTPIGQGS